MRGEKLRKILCVDALDIEAKWRYGKLLEEWWIVGMVEHDEADRGG